MSTRKVNGGYVLEHAYPDEGEATDHAARLEEIAALARVAKRELISSTLPDCDCSESNDCPLCAAYFNLDEIIKAATL